MSDTPDTPRHRAGNTKARPVISIRSRSWFFTLNNFTAEDITYFTDTLDTEKYAFQHEVGESGTHHLQGVIYFSNARTFDQIKQLHSTAHWEKTRCLKGAIGYCCDPKKRANPRDIWVKGWTIPKPIKIIENLFPWQEKIIDIINEEPDDRTINWFWDPIGNIGKTALMKYILFKYKNCFYFTGGKANDIAYQIIDSNYTPEICLFDFPREAEGCVSYNSMERLKNGIINSHKYKGGTKIFNSPHVIVVANWPPDLNALSADRWNVINLSENDEAVLV